MKPEIVGTITEDFHLKLAIPRMMENTLREIGPGVQVTVAVKKWRKPRTGKQNSYLWAVVYPTILRYIKDCTGQDFTADQLHERYKRKYLGYEVCDVPGMDDLIKPKSSKDTDTEEFWEKLIEPICLEWSEKGAYIALPTKKNNRGE